MHRFRRAILAAYLLVIFLVVHAGCDQTINPIIGENRPFTLWGYLDAKSDTQWVRVFAISSELGVDRSGPIDAVVRSFDLETGELQEWTATKVEYADSTIGDVFFAAFRPAFDRKYRLEAIRSDGQTSSAEVTIPPEVRVELVDERTRIQIPAVIHGKPPSLVQVQVVYDAITLPPVNPWPPGSRTPEPVRIKVAVPYDNLIEPTPDGWKMEINQREDFSVVQNTFELNCLRTDLIALRRVELRFLAADAQWQPPEGSFDPNLLIEPAAFSNVENGFGYFGGGYVVSERWTPTETVMRTIGYRVNGPCPLMPVNIPECQVPPEPCLKGDGN